jgi:hypothetical protein
MTRGFAPFGRIAAMAAAIALFAAPMAAAQTPAPAQAGDPPAPTVLLSAGAFARLAKAAQQDLAPVPVVPNAPRLAGLPHNPTASARRADASRPEPPKSSRTVGQKIVITLGVVGILAGAMAIAAYTGAEFGDVLEGLFALMSR